MPRRETSQAAAARVRQQRSGHARPGARLVRVRAETAVRLLAGPPIASYSARGSRDSWSATRSRSVPGTELSRTCPYLNPEIVQESDGVEGVVEVTPASVVIAKDPPVFEARNRVLDTRSTLAMPTPSLVPD